MDLVDVEQGDQTGAGLFDVGAAPDQRDHFVEHVEGLDQAPIDVGFFFALAQAIASTPLDDLDLVGDPVADELVDRQGAGYAVDQRQHVGRKVALQFGVLEKVVEHHPRHGVALEDDYQPLAGAGGGVVAHIGDALHPTGVGEFGDLQGEIVWVDHVGEL